MHGWAQRWCAKLEVDWADTGASETRTDSKSIQRKSGALAGEKYLRADCEAVLEGNFTTKYEKIFKNFPWVPVGDRR